MRIDTGSRATDPRRFGLAFGAALLVATVVLSIAADKAAAATLNLVGGTPYVLPSGPGSIFNPAGWNNTDVNAGDTVYVFNADNVSSSVGLFVSPQIVDVKFEYLGTEAGNDNQALIEFNGTPLFDTFTDTAGVTPAVTMTLDAGGNPGLLPFLFETMGNVAGTPFSIAANGGPITGGTEIAFSQVFTELVGGLYYNYVYAFFEDWPDDHDFDDMVVKISLVAPVPVPPALLLFGSGLAGLGFLARHRKQKAPARASS